MLSLTCKTAIKAVIYLASKFDSREMAGMNEVARFINASEHTVGKMLQSLVKAGVINSVKGPNGGFYINAMQMNQPIIKIINAIDGIAVFDRCILGLSKCATAHPCPIHHEYKIMRDQFSTMCRKKKVSELCSSVNDGLSYLMG